MTFPTRTARPIDPNLFDQKPLKGTTMATRVDKPRAVRPPTDSLSAAVKANRARLAGIAALERREVALNDAKERFLRQQGWNYECGFPDHRWRWVKTIDGERITDDTDGAIRIEGYLR